MLHVFLTREGQKFSPHGLRRTILRLGVFLLTYLTQGQAIGRGLRALATPADRYLTVCNVRGIYCSGLCDKTAHIGLGVHAKEAHSSAIRSMADTISLVLLQQLDPNAF